MSKVVLLLFAPAQHSCLVEHSALLRFFLVDPLPLRDTSPGWANAMTNDLRRRLSAGWRKTQSARHAYVVRPGRYECRTRWCVARRNTIRRCESNRSESQREQGECGRRAVRPEALVKLNPGRAHKKGRPRGRPSCEKLPQNVSLPVNSNRRQYPAELQTPAVPPAACPPP